MLLSLATGGVSSFALAGMTDAYDGKTLLAAHVAGLIGAALIFGFAVSVRHLRYAPRNVTRLAFVFTGGQFANWFLSSVKAFLFVHGIAPGGSAANMGIYVALSITVVVPMLVGCSFWVLGFRSAGSGASGNTAPP